MNSKTKKIILGIITALLVIFLSWLLMFRKDNKKQAAPIPIIQEENSGKQIQVSFDIVLDQKILFPVLSADNKFLVYYDNDADYVFYKSLADQINAKQKISPAIKDILDAAWSPSKNKVILKVVYDKEILATLGIKAEQPAIKNSVFMLLDIGSQKIIPLYKEINAIEWLNDEKIIYTVGGAENQILYIADSDGSSYEKLVNLGDIKSSISELAASPDGKKILLQAVNALMDENNIYLLDIESKALSKIAEEDITAPLWSPDGSKFLFLKISESGEFYLYSANSKGEEVKNLEVKTMPGKFVWDAESQNIFVAIPQEIINMQSFREQFYKINIETKEKNKLSPIDNRGYFDAQNLMPTADGKTLYFTSDDFLYRIDIGTGNG